MPVQVNRPPKATIYHIYVYVAQAPGWNEEAFKEAASLGLIQVLEEQKNLKVVSRWSHKVWCAAAEAGQVDVLHWALQQSSTLSMDLRQCLIVAAESGKYQCCSWIFRNFPRWFRSNTAMVIAAETGRWAAVRMLCSLLLFLDVKEQFESDL